MKIEVISSPAPNSSWLRFRADTERETCEILAAQVNARSSGRGCLSTISDLQSAFIGTH